MLSLTFCFCMLCYVLQLQIRDAGKEETALAVYWMTNGVDSSWVGFVSQHLIKLMEKYNFVLVQIIDVFSAADDCNYRRQKVYKNDAFAIAVLILACDASNEADEAMVYATTSREDTTTNTQKRHNNTWKEKISRNKENEACWIMLLNKITTVI